ATPLSVAAEANITEGTQDIVSTLAAAEGGIFTFWNMFMGFIPGSIGETSTLMALIGILILVVTGVGSWKIIVCVFGGALAMGYILSLAGANEFMLMPAHYHWVMGGLAF